MVTRSILRPVLRPVTRAVSDTIRGFNPRSLFASGEQGIWLDPSDFSTLFQDSAGTTPVTALGQPVGLALDKRLGMVLGSELVTNGGFDTDTAWTASNTGTGTAVISGGVLTLTGTDTSNRGRSYQALSVESGKMYRVTLAKTGSASSVWVGTSPGGSGVAAVDAASSSFVFLATAATVYLMFLTTSAGGTANFDNISVRELTGNHAYQTTSASRPTVEARVNLLTYSEQLDHADWSKLGVTVTANAGVGYDGITNLDKVMEVSAASIPRITQSRPTIIGQTYIAYFDAKAAERTQIRIVAEGSLLRSAIYDLSTGVVIYQGVSASAYITALGNGLYRCWMIYTAAGAGSALYVNTVEAGSTVTSGDPTKGVFLGRADFRLASDSAYPYQRVNTATDYADIGAPRYLSFDGTDDGMATPSIDFTGTDKMTVWAGAKSNSEAANAVLFELSNATGPGNPGSMAILWPRLPYAVNFALAGTALASRSTSASADTGLRVISCAFDISTALTVDEIKPKVNGAGPSLLTIDAGPAGTGNFGTYPLYIGRRGGASLPFNGRIYQLIIRGAASNDGQIAAGEAWCNSKARAY